MAEFDGMSEAELDAYWKGVEAEQERIIKLLEAMMNTRPIETNSTYWGYSFERIIALIKGKAE